MAMEILPWGSALSRQKGLHENAPMDISVTEFRAQCLELIRQVECGGTPHAPNRALRSGTPAMDDPARFRSAAR